MLALCMLGSAAFLHCGFRQDEVECEEAIHHLSECCSGFDPTKFRCTFDSGCGSQTLPDLPTNQSECILDESCDGIRSGKVCERLLAQLNDGMLQNGSFETTNRQAEDVCP